MSLLVTGCGRYTRRIEPLLFLDLRLANPGHRCRNKRMFASSTRRLSSPTGLRYRLGKLNSRIPRYLQRYTTPLFRAPMTHVSAFLILHELTAVIPLFGFAGLFHYTGWLPLNIFELRWGAEGVDKLTKYARRKNWIEEEDQEEIEQIEQDCGHRNDGQLEAQARPWSEGRIRVLAEFATAYAITKALLPARLVFSVWATPWFAGKFLQPLLRLMPQQIRSGPVYTTPASSAAMAKGSPAAGTNAVGGGVSAAGLRR